MPIYVANNDELFSNRLKEYQWICVSLDWGKFAISSLCANLSCTIYLFKEKPSTMIKKQAWFLSKIVYF